MKHLYLDNVRGFQHTIIPFGEVTFLVGDNSTGKSTVLSILHILSRGTLLGEYDFDADDYHMGGFDDLVSSKSPDKTRFTIGLSRVISEPSSSFACIYFISFESDDGVPVARRFSYLDDKVFVSIRHTPRGLSYRLVPTDSHLTKDKTILKESVKKLSELHNQRTTKGFFPLPNYPADRIHPYLLFIAPVSLKMDPQKTLIPNTLDPIRRMNSGAPPVWIAPIRAKPKRTYDSSRISFNSEGTHAPYLIRKFLLSGNQGSKFRETLEACGSEGSLFDSVHIKKFGDSNHGPFEVQIDLGGSKHSIANVGYGVSQVIPILAEGISQKKGTEFHIQQPEVHLHPKAQASLGSLLWKLVEEDDKLFVIETHSDYVIDRFRYNISNSQKSKKCSVIFFTRGLNGNQIHEVEILSDGSYSEDQPEGFRDFFIDEQMKLLSI